MDEALVNNELETKNFLFEKLHLFYKLDMLIIR